MAKYYSKLVRDKVPSLIEEDGRIAHYNILNGEEYKIALKRKMVEEVGELIEAESEEEMKEGLVDIAEVVDAIIKAYDFNPKELIDRQFEKLDKKGGFERGLYLYKVE